MTNNKTKFTVIVPTRERADTLYYCLQTIIMQRYDNLEILVSDNFSHDNTEAVTRSFNDARVRYINTGRRLSMSHNWEFALSHVKDGWVTIVGDDDGLMPGCLQYVDEVARATGCLAVNSSWCLYFWPNSGVRPEAEITVPLGKGYEIRKSIPWLRKVMSGQASYPDLPCIYTGGFASIEAINRCRDTFGTFFRSMTPDVYSAVALASTLDTYVMVHRPLAIAATSRHSNGASSLGMNAIAAPSAIYYSEPNIPFHPSLGDGKIKSPSLLTYECYLQSSHLHKNYLNLHIEHQLAVALVTKLISAHHSVKQYVRSLCVDRNLDFEAIVRKSRAIWIFAIFRLLRDDLRSLFSSRTIVGAYAATNVHEAAWVAATIYSECAGSKSKHWEYLKARAVKRFAQAVGLIKTLIAP